MTTPLEQILESIETQRFTQAAALGYASTALVEVQQSGLRLDALAKEAAEALRAEHQPAPEREKEKPKPEPTPTPQPSPGDVGRVPYWLFADGYFDPIAKDPATPGWLKAKNVQGMTAYLPERAKQFPEVKVVCYEDFGTEGAKNLTPSSRATYEARLTANIRSGMHGLFADDTNLSPRFMPDVATHAEILSLFTEIRQQHPTALICINTQYHDLQPFLAANDPTIRKILVDVNLVCKEFGVGPTAGITTAQDFQDFIAYVDRLHLLGIGVIMMGDWRHTDAATMEYNQAVALLNNNGMDYVSGVNQVPTNWWSGFDVNLGTEITTRQRRFDGLWSRSFEHGVVYASEPGGAPRPVSPLGASVDLGGNPVVSLSLPPGSGKVLRYV